MSIVASLEIGTRAARVLDEMGVDSLEKLRDVRRSEFLRVRGAGARSWAEVEAVQRRIRGAVAEGGREKAKALAAALNDAMREDPRLVAVVINGRVRIAEMV